jgi:hypothetical protein
VFEKRKERKLEAEHQREAAAERQRATEQLRTMAASLPDADGVVAPQDFVDLLEFVGSNDIALRDVPDVRDLLLLGLAQGGYFLKILDSTLLLKKDETALWDEPADLLKEVTDREFQAGSQGVSVPLGGGIRYHVGQTRGHMVTIGSHWTNADSGTLTVTDQRIVYHGGRKTIEFPYKKLATLNVYQDAIDLGVTSRQTTSSFAVNAPALVAGLIHAALNHIDGEITLISMESEDAT